MGKLEGVGAATLRREKAPVQNAPIIQTKQPRLSADVSPDDYKWLYEFCVEIANVVGRVKVKHVWVIRALIHELRENPELKLSIINRVREENPLDSK